MQQSIARGGAIQFPQLYGLIGIIYSGHRGRVLSVTVSLLCIMHTCTYTAKCKGQTYTTFMFRR